MSLHPVRGHVDVLRGLTRAVRNGALPFPLLIHGSPGVGKQRVALWLAQLLLCEDRGEEGPCGSCKGCRMALRLEHPDLHWYFPLPRPKGVSGPDRLADALEEARAAALAERRADPLATAHEDEPTGLYLATARALRRRAQRRPSMADVQVFIIGEAETLVPQESSPEAANALLKLLEEPPEGTRVILTSNEPGRLLPTIRSRSAPLHLAPLSRAEVRGFLEDACRVDPDTAEWAADLSRGSIGRALGFLPDEDGEHGPLEAERRKAFRLLRTALEGRQGPSFVQALDFPPVRARALLGLLAFVEEWLRDLAAVASGAPEAVVNVDARKPLEELHARSGVDPVKAAEAVASVEEARFLASGNVNPQLVVSGVLRDLRRALRPRASEEEGGRAPSRIRT